MDKSLADKCFEENYYMTAKDPEKANLYKGLGRMAVMLQDLLAKVDRLEHEIQALKRRA
jgi:hypothetical protein